MLKGLHLTMLVGPTVPVVVPWRVVDALESARVEVGGERDGFELKFALEKYSSLIETFVLAGSQSLDFRVILFVTLNATPHVIFDGLMSHHQVDKSGGAPKLVVQGTGLTQAMDRDDLTGLVQYPCLGPAARVRMILAKYARFGLIPMVFPSLGDAIPDPLTQTPVHRGTDLQYIKELAERAGNQFFVVPGPAPGTNLAYWGPPVKIGAPQPPLNGDMDAHKNVESLSFRIDAEQHEQPVVVIYEPITKMPIPVPIPGFSPLSPPLGLIRPQARRKTRVPDTSKKPFLEALLEGFAAASKAQDTVFGSGSLNVLRYGHVLRAKHPVSVRGATSPFDGLYYVDRVTHEIQRGQYTQSFELRRDGLVSTVPLAPMVTA